MGEIPAKLFFRIGEVAGLVGVEPHVLRYWEREFRSIRPTKSAKGQRVYSRKDVENLLRVRDLLYRDGFTIAGAKKKLRGADDDVTLAGDHTPESAAHGPHEVDPSNEGHADPSTLVARDEGRTSEVRATSCAPPASACAPSSPPSSRDKLVALRSEVEAFLAELAPHRNPESES